MSRRLKMLGALVAACWILLPTAAAHGGSTSPSPAADPHAGHDMSGMTHDDGQESHEGHDMGGVEPSAGTASGHEHEHGSTGEDHSEHAGSAEGGSEGGGHEHGGTAEEPEGHDDHGQRADTVSPELKRLVLSGFAGVNVAVILGAFLVRRTRPNPDPRKRNARADR
jgi:hypothetical protein